jgi:hypothetical protein
MDNDKRATTQWDKSSISYKNYQSYIANKPQKFELTLIDLLYISNFKGGNATINEPEGILNKKLKLYSEILIKIDEDFVGSSLNELSEEGLDRLIVFVLEICELTDKTKPTNIDGFSVSYLSALLNTYFPKIIPILDRRVLINMGLVTNADITNQGQIKNIKEFYKPLIKSIHLESINTDENIREIDRRFFIIKID